MNLSFLRFNIFILTGICLLLCIYTGIYSSLFQGLEKNIDIIWGCIGIGFIIGIVWIIIQQKSYMKGRWAKPSNLLFLSSFIVSFQWLADDALGYNPEGMLVSPNKSAYTYSAILGLIAVASITIGYCIGLLKNKSRNKKYSKLLSKKPIYLLIGLYYVFFLLFIVNINIIDFVTGAAYSESKEITAYRYYESLANYAAIATISQILCNNTNKNNKTLKNFISIFPVSFLIPITLYIILRGLSGDRGPVITLFLMFFFAYLYYTKKSFKLTTMLFAVLIVGSAISIIGIARSMSTDMAVGEKFSSALSDFNSSGRFGGKSIFPPTQELSLSFVCANEAVTEIEIKKEDYNYGLYQFVHTIEMIPYAPSFLRESLKIDDHKISTAGRVSDGALGTLRGWSLGTSMITDFYLDLGSFGVFLGCIFVGFAYSWVDRQIFGLSPKITIYTLAIALYLSSKALYMARTAFLGEFRPIVYICLFLFINNIIFSKKK